MRCVFKAKLDELPDSSVIIVQKADGRGRLRPDAKSTKESDITALLRDEKNDDGGFASDAALMKAASKNMIRGGGLDELFEGTHSKPGSKKEKLGAEEEREKNKSRELHKSLKDCRFCFENGRLEDAMVTVGQYVYLAVTGAEPMTDGHMLLVPREHTANLPASDETVAREMLDMRRKLTSMWAKEDKEPVFITTATRKGLKSHFITEVIPIDIEEAELAPMFFQKAFQDAEGMFGGVNKAVINTMKEQSHYRKVPPQLGMCSMYNSIHPTVKIIPN